ncbi:MAG: PAS domain S-box protein [Verrucomicrobiales bacterium]|nr:PAS domain S-box protein [Verrucomicrobiales bacterium]
MKLNQNTLSLRASETRYRRLFEAAQDGILILNAATGRIEDVNPFLTGLLGYTRAELLGNPLWEIGPFRDVQASKAEFRELQRESYVRYDDLPLETKAGRSIHVEFVSNVYEVNRRKVIQCNVRDITERKESEDRQREYVNRVQVLSRRLVEAQEIERREVARELHDELGQTLTVAQINLQTLLRGARAGDRDRLQQCLDAVERVLQQVQDIALQLRPCLLDDLGLEPALVWLAHRQARLAGLSAEVQVDPLEGRLDSLLETVCFRIGQEALTNVARHSRATSVVVELRRRGREIHLFIRDNGVGFDVAAVRKKAVGGNSLGLLSMEERATLAGGHFQIQSTSQQGTEVHAWFPLQWKTEELGGVTA